MNPQEISAAISDERADVAQRLMSLQDRIRNARVLASDARRSADFWDRERTNLLSQLDAEFPFHSIRIRQLKL